MRVCVLMIQKYTRLNLSMNQFQKRYQLLRFGLINKWSPFPSSTLLTFKSAVEKEPDTLKVYRNIALRLWMQCTDIAHITVHV